MKRFHSLSARLLLATVAVTGVFTLISGIALQQAFEQSLELAERDKLQSQIYLLLGALEVSNGDISLSETLAEPRFSTLNSGLYGWVVGTDQIPRWQSPSAQLITLPDKSELPPFQPGTPWFGATQIGGDSLFLLSFDVSWITEDNREVPLRLLIAQSQESFLATLNRFQHQLWQWLGTLSLALLLTLWLLVRWGLKPMRHLARQIKAIENGQQQSLTGHYPSEIQPLVDNLQQLLTSERRQQERYRNTLGDLAHSLKTPLAVIRSLLGSGDSATDNQIETQVERMNSIVQHQLQRAVQVKTQPMAGNQVDIHRCVERLLDTLQKVYRDKQISSAITGSNPLPYPGHEADLMELLGNLLENAFKYGQQQVQVTLTNRADTIAIVIDDDGKGVAEEQQAWILQRGQRADTATPGQGIGLAVTTDIISGYGGSLKIERSPLGGARFRVSLPR